MSSTSSSYLKEFTFEDIVSIITDFTANGSFESLRLNVKYYYEENYARLIRLTDLRKGLKNDGVYVDSAGYEYLKKSSLQENDLLLANVGEYTGFVCLMPELEQHSTLAPNMFLIRFEPFIDSKFMYYLMSGDAFTNAVDCISASSATKLLNKTNLRKMVIHLPELPKQQKIAEILITVDNLIDQTQNLIDKYTTVKQGMMADLFSRGIDLSGTPETNKNYGQLRPSFDDAPELYQETELGWVPVGWKVEILGEVAEVIDPQPDHRTPPESENGVPYVGVGDFYWDQRIDRERCRKVINAAYDKQRNRFHVELGDSIFGKIGTIGQPKQLQETEGFTLSANILLIKAKEKNDYVYSFFDSVIFNKQLSNIINTTSQPALGIQTMRDISIAYPKCDKELQTITERLNAINLSLVSYRKELHKYQLLKKGLMQDLLTGKVSVI